MSQGRLLRLHSLLRLHVLTIVLRCMVSMTSACVSTGVSQCGDIVQRYLTICHYLPSLMERYSVSMGDWVLLYRHWTRSGLLTGNRRWEEVDHCFKILILSIRFLMMAPCVTCYGVTQRILRGKDRILYLNNCKLVSSVLLWFKISNCFIPYNLINNLWKLLDVEQLHAL